MFRPMWSSSDVKITGRGNRCLVLLLMLLIYNSPRCVCVSVTCVNSSVRIDVSRLKSLHWSILAILDRYTE
jgi:hypothetical protein